MTPSSAGPGRHGAGRPRSAHVGRSGGLGTSSTHSWGAQPPAPEGWHRVGPVQRRGDGVAGGQARSSLALACGQAGDPGALPEAAPGGFHGPAAPRAGRVCAGESRPNAVARPERRSHGAPQGRLLLGSTLQPKARQEGGEAASVHAAAEPLAQVMELGAAPQANLEGVRKPSQYRLGVVLGLRVDHPSVAPRLRLLPAVGNEGLPASPPQGVDGGGDGAPGLGAATTGRFAHDLLPDRLDRRLIKGRERAPQA